jgi:hypothetical protein
VTGDVTHISKPVQDVIRRVRKAVQDDGTIETEGQESGAQSTNQASEPPHETS